ncbi:MAG: hypothetical protein WC941_11115 [Candidatus Bathyarchaeia archaeon]
MLVGLENPNDDIEVSRSVAGAAASRGYGAVFGAPLIGAWDPEEKKNIEAFERDLGSGFAVSITDHPLQTSAFEIIRRGSSYRYPSADQPSGIAGFVRDLARIRGIRSLTFVVSTDPDSAFEMPKHQLTVDEFVSHLSRYEELEADPRAEFWGDGVFELRLKSPPNEERS